MSFPNIRSYAKVVARRRVIFPTCFFMALLFCTSVAWAEVADELFAFSTLGKLDKVEEFLSSGVDINAKTSNGRTALMGAASYGNYRIVKTLVAYGADINLADNAGTTALMDAVVFGHYEIINLLTTLGADVNAAAANGKTVLDKAKAVGDKKVIARLEKAGAKGGEEGT